MKSAKLLIDMAREKCTSDADIARRIGIRRQDLHQMRTGERALSPETVAALCDLLELPGEEAREWLAIAIIENPKNEAKRSLLERALFACWACGAASLLTLFIGAPGTAWSAPSRTETRATNALGGYVSVTDTIFIVAYAIRRALRRLLRSVRDRARVPQPAPGVKGAARALAVMGASAHP